MPKYDCEEVAERRFQVEKVDLCQEFWCTFYLKCIWNEIFDNNFIALPESALKDKINAVYRLLITCLDPRLWRSEVLKKKRKNGNKSSKNQ